MFFKRKKAIDRVQFIKMNKDIDIYKLGDRLLKGIPLVINFEQYNAIEANKVITFLSGITYAIDGEVEVIQQYIFLFATKQDYKDGSLRDFVEQYKE